MPLYPIEAIPVEYAHYSKFLIENPPNIIITSSNMALTHYKESDTLCVNVQTLLKTPGQITYGLFNIQPPQIQDRIAFKLVKDSFN